MTNKKIEFIRSKCIAANPSIKDLVLGCLCHDAYGQLHVILSKTEKGFLLKNIDERRKDIEYETVEHPYPGINPNDIIGRPIRLADILLAISYSEIVWKREDIGFSCDIQEDHHIFAMATNEHGTAGWDLRNDDLEKQSQEAIDLLFEIMGDDL